MMGNLDMPNEAWLKKLFWNENCGECGRGAKGHIAIPFNGNWFAKCKKKGVKHD